MVANTHKRLSLGQTVLSGACLEVCNQVGVSPDVFFQRQRRGDWGDVPAVIAIQNWECVRSGGPICGKHTCGPFTLYVVTFEVNGFGIRTETRLLTDAEYGRLLLSHVTHMSEGDWG